MICNQYPQINCKGLQESEGAAKHVQFEGYDRGADGSPYGASIPISKAFSPYGDVLLAYLIGRATKKQLFFCGFPWCPRFFYSFKL